MGSLLGTAIALVVKVVVVFTVLTGLVFWIAPTDAGHFRAKAIATVSFAVTGVVDLAQSVGSAAKDAAK